MSSNNIIKAFAKQSGKTEAEVEEQFNKAIVVVKQDNPAIEYDSDKFYLILSGVLKSMLSIKTENDGACISSNDVSQGTTTPFASYIKRKRKFKKTVSETSLPYLNRVEQQMIMALRNDSSNISVNIISEAKQLTIAEAMKTIKHGVHNKADDDVGCFISADVLQNHTSKLFYTCVENLFAAYFDAALLNEPSKNDKRAYDLIKGKIIFSVKSTTKGTREAVNKNSNHITCASLITSAYERHLPSKFKYVSNHISKYDFLGVDAGVSRKDELISATKAKANSCVFAGAYIDQKNILHLISSVAILEADLLEYIYTKYIKSKIETISFNHILNHFGSVKETTIDLSHGVKLKDIKQQAIDVISNIERFDTMQKIIDVLGK